MAYGILPEGFAMKPFDAIVDEMVADLRPTWGASYDFSEGSPDGQLLRAVARQIHRGGWQLAEAVYKSRDRDSATGQALDALLLITGTLRPDPAWSTVTLTLTGSAGTTVAADARVKTASSGVVFLTTEEKTLTALTAWAGSTAYVLGDRRSNGGRSYVCITAGTSASSGGPSGTAADITDGAVHWRHLGSGSAAADVEARSVDYGPVLATSGDLTVIDTVIGGWAGVINLLDADPGRLVATDGEARLLSDADVFRAGATVPDAIRQTLVNVTGVTEVTVFINDTDTTDGAGVPPHAVECLVTGGDDQAIRDALLAEAIAAGIVTYGGVTGTATDSVGTAHTVRFSRPTEVPIYVALSLDKIAHKASDPGTYPSDGDAQVVAAVVAYGDKLPSGWDVRARKVGAQAEGIAGVLAVTACNIGTSPSPSSSTTISITSRQRAVFDTSRVTVTSSDATP